MPLEAGERVGPYEILGPIGAGGMGEVYKAHDSRLNRQVAIKRVRAGSSSSGDSRARFLREARAASELNHPNVVTIYHLLTQNDDDLIVMEHVEGKPLQERIPKKGIPAAEALDIAIQIAAAVAAAHEHGIIHRDLKPANILVSASGFVKVLDFGLAKRTTVATTSGIGEGHATRTIGVEQPITAPHVILGTLQYMSPEQIQGQELDTRSDIFSFGSVLYEILTGRQPFTAESEVATLAAIVHSESPTIRELAPIVPHDLERVIARCMKKDPSCRYQHMADVKIVLEDRRESLGSGDRSTRAEPRRRLPLVSAAMIAAAAVTGTAVWYIAVDRPLVEPLSDATFTQVTADSGLSAFPALSSDGKLIAYASDRAGSLDIWVQQVGGTQPLRVTADQGNEYEPSFSPDGSTIVYRSDREEGGGIYSIPTLGGEPRRLAREGRGPRFSADGKQVLYGTGESHAAPSKAFVIPVVEGAPRQIAPEFFSVRLATWSPDGKRVLFYGRQRAQFSENAGAWWTIDLRTGDTVKVSDLQMVFTQWLPDGRLLLAKGQDGRTNLASARFDSTGRNIVGITLLTAGATNETGASAAGPHIAFAAINTRTNVWALPIEADTGKVTGALTRLTDGEGSHIRPTISTDGNVLGFSRTVGIGGIFKKDLTSGKETLIRSVRHPRLATPELSPDGRAIVYSFGEEPDSLFVSSSDGDNEKLCDGRRLPTSWLPAKEELIFEQRGAQGLVLLNTRTRQQLDLIKDAKVGVSDGEFSPDGRWVAFHVITSANTGTVHVARREGAQLPMPRSEWIPITRGRFMDRYASWSPNGNILYFLSERDGDRCIFAQRLHPEQKTPAGEPFAVHHFQSPKLSLMSVGDPVSVRLATAKNKLIFALAESSGNIWLRTEQQPAR